MNKLIFTISTILLFAACEYEPSGTNFLDLTPPEDYIPVDISLNEIDPSDTIYLYRNALISIKISSPKELLRAEVLLDGEKYKNMSANTFDFMCYPDEIDEGEHKLTVVAGFTSGTGSLAEIMGMEGYMGEMSWNIRVIHNLKDRFKVKHRINEEGFLELYWNNAIPDSYIEGYTINSIYTQKADITINDARQKSFVDYGYVCGNVSYEVKTYLKDGNVFSRMHSVNSPTPTIHFEDLGLDSLRVYWDKPLANGRFYFIEDNDTIAAVIHDTSIVIPQLFGSPRQFSLEIKPQNPEYDIFHNKFTDLDKFCQGASLKLPNRNYYAYNKTDNILYTRRYDDLVAFDANSLQEINAVSINGNPWGFAYGGKIATAPHNSTVVAMTGEDAWIFTDSRFISPIIISPLFRGNSNTRLSALTDNDRFFVVEGNAEICKIFNSLTGKKIFEIPFTYKTKYTFPDFITVSENGQFFCASSEDGIEIFEINGTTANLLYTDTRHYEGAMFVPSQSDKLLILVDADIEIRQMPDFNLIQRLDVSAHGAMICNIDPASMSLLYYQNDSLKVCKINSITETIFKIRVKNGDKTCIMFNNKLFSEVGIYFDINPYLID